MKGKRLKGVEQREGRDVRGVEQREGRGLRVWFSNSKQIFKKKTIIFQGKVSFKKKSNFQVKASFKKNE